MIPARGRAAAWRRSVCAVLVLLGAAASVVAATAAFGESEERGRRIFLRGETPSGSHGTALIGAQSLEVPISRMPCASCHGFDGSGRPEGGLAPPDITWRQLTKSYGHVHDGGRRHGPFTADSLARLLATGIDPAGNQLDAAMPRYRLSAADTADLVAFMKRLGTPLEVGVSDSVIRVGTILPPPGPLAEAGEAMRAVMAAYFADIAARGGIYGRRIELVAVARAEDPRTTANDVRRMAGDVFAVVGGFIAGAEEELLGLIEGTGVPLVGPLTLFPRDDPAGRGRQTFYLLSGVPQEALALVDHAVRTPAVAGTRFAVVHPLGGPFASISEAVASRASAGGWASAGTFTYQRLEPSRLVGRLADQRVEAVFFFGSGPELQALRREASRIGWSARFFVSGSLSGVDVPPARKGSADGGVAAAYALLPGDQSPAGRAELDALRIRHGIAAKHVPVQVSALVAAKVLVEGLRRTGQTLTRDGLVGALEQLDRFETGLMPRIGYGKNRHIGVPAAHVVTAPLPATSEEPARALR